MDLVCLSPPCGDAALHTLDLARIATAALLAILFLQSGIDKIVDRKSNLEWLTGHFSKSPLAKMVVPMLTTITIVEVFAGALSAIGALQLLVTSERTIATLGALLAVAAILMLFFGQRIAKDYAGAAALVPYFVVAAGGLAVMGMP
jgi:predicted RND superfamily exporter protein